MIPQQTINKILDAAHIEEVIDEFITLKKRGVNHIALCPFHNEKTPSFTVSPSKGIFKCFGCGEAGNVVNFVMKHESYTYPEALRYLAEKYNIEIEPLKQEEIDAEKEQTAINESLYIVNNFAKQYFSKLLLEHEEGKAIGLSYLKERGFRENVIRKFELGYCLNSQDAFTKEALKSGYKSGYLKKTGLTTSRNNQDHDFFRDRVLFPIHNLSGKVIAFGGRTLKKDDKIPKYINSPESDIYQKSKIVYGIFFARDAIRKNEECCLVEGYTDVISLHQAGIENVVASSGTSLTQDQIRLISRYTKNITILFDGDAAGLKAAFRGIDLILEQDLNVKIVLLPEGEDPDSYVNKLEGAGFRDYIKDNKKDFILMKAGLLLKEVKNDPVKKAEVINEIVASIAKIPDHIKRSLFVKECSSILRVEEQLLVTTVNKLRRRAYKKTARLSTEEATQIEEVTENITSPRQEGVTTDAVQERDIIRVLLEYGNKKLSDGQKVGEYIIQEVEEMEVENELYNAMLKEIIAKIKKEKKLEIKDFVHHADSKISKTAIDLTTSQYLLSKNWYKKHDVFVREKDDNFEKDVLNVVAFLKLKKVIKRIKANEQELKNANDDEQRTLQEKHMQLNQYKKQLCDYLGTVVIK